MRLQKIISGGQTGADRAALDTAIKFNIGHGGWVPAGRLAEDGPIPKIYRVREMKTSSHEDRTAENVATADATVIMARGVLTGGTLLTLEIAKTYHAPCCHLDLLTMDEFEAALLLHEFFDESGGAIATLNVAGPRASQDPFIYRSVKSILEAFIFLEMTQSDQWKLPQVGDVDFEMSIVDALFLPSAQPDVIDANGHGCQTPQAAVSLLAKRLPFRVRSIIANLGEDRIGRLYFSMCDALSQWLGMDMGNHRLLAACRSEGVTNPSEMDPGASDLNILLPDWPDRAIMDNEDAVMFILKALQIHLQRHYQIRRLK